MSDGHDFRHVTPSVGYGTKSRVLLLSAVVCFFVCFSYATTVTCCGHALLWPPLLFPYCLTTIIEQRMVSLLLASVGLVLAVASSSPVAAQNTTVQTTKGAISGVVVGDDDSVFAYWGYDLTQTTCLVLSPNLFFYLFLFLWSTPHTRFKYPARRAPGRQPSLCLAPRARGLVGRAGLRRAQARLVRSPFPQSGPIPFNATVPRASSKTSSVSLPTASMRTVSMYGAVFPSLTVPTKPLY